MAPDNAHHAAPPSLPDARPLSPPAAPQVPYQRSGPDPTHAGAPDHHPHTAPNPTHAGPPHHRPFAAPDQTHAGASDPAHAGPPHHLPFAAPDPTHAGASDAYPGGAPGSPAGRAPTSPAAAAASPGGPPANAGDDPAAGKSGPSTGVIVGVVLIGATLLVLAALSVPFLLQRLSDPGPASYSVGDCVVQAGDNARSADCNDPGAFQVVSQVESRNDCEDPTQPAIVVEGPPVVVYCLAPAAATE